jgi:uncharacterized DUF497 family protein
MVTFVWQTWNLEHISRHGADRKTVEAIFYAPDFTIQEPSPHVYRETAFGTVDGKTWRVIFIRTSSAEIFPITAHRLSPNRRS